MTCLLLDLNMTGGLGMKESKFYRIEYSFCYENDDDTQLVSHGWDIKSASFTDGVADINRQTFEKQCAQSASRRWLCLLKHGYKVDVEPLQRAPLTCRARIQQELHPGDLTEFDRNMWENLLTEFGDVEKRWVSTKVLKQKSEWNQLNDVNDPWTETYPIYFSNFREKQLDEGATELNRVFFKMRNAYQSGARYSAKE